MRQTYLVKEGIVCDLFARVEDLQEMRSKLQGMLHEFGNAHVCGNIVHRSSEYDPRSS